MNIPGLTLLRQDAMVQKMVLGAHLVRGPPEHGLRPSQETIR